MNNNHKVQDLPKDERPRERLQQLGIEALSAEELLALIVQQGSKEASVLDLVRNLISSYKSLENLSQASFHDLMKFKGIGIAKASKIKAAFELAKRMQGTVTVGNVLPVKKPEDIARLMTNELRGEKKEHFFAILLDTRHKVIKKVRISTGTLNASLVHPREVFKEAITTSAASLILVHNHPSGDCTPSAEDSEITRRLVETGKIMGIDVLDHIIISDQAFLSMKREGFF